MDDFGIVLFGNGVNYNVMYQGEEIIASLRGKLLHTTKRSHHPVCAGDHVKIIKKDEKSYQIDKILPRKNRISRPSNNFIRKEQVLSANIDYMFLIASVYSPRLNSSFLDRLLAFSNMQQIETIIVINKMDLGVTSEEVAIIKGYRDIGFTVIETSVLDNHNVDKIKEMTKDKISAFIGNSGVGKSSLLNKIDKDVMQKVSATSEYSLKGRHTTKQARLFTLENGGFVIDTPGIKEFGLWNIDYRELKDYFPEIHALSGNCKYSNCLHISEPSCAVIEAVDNGDIPLFRYENYLKIYETLFENKDIYFKKDK